jgi:E3 ubiquitin-protein ligase RNF115/126
MANLPVNDPYTSYYNNFINNSNKINIKQYEHITFDTSINIKSCPISLVDFEIGEEIIKLPCSHIFSLNSLEEWLKEKQTCPVCRHELKKDRTTTINTQIDSLINFMSQQLRNSDAEISETLQTYFEIY